MQLCFVDATHTVMGMPIRSFELILFPGRAACSSSTIGEGLNLPPVLGAFPNVSDHTYADLPQQSVMQKTSQRLHPGSNGASGLDCLQSANVAFAVL